MSEDIEQEEESLFEAPPMAEQERMCEAILFATAEPVTVRELEARMPHGSDAAEALGASAQTLRGARREPGQGGRCLGDAHRA